MGMCTVNVLDSNSDRRVSAVRVGQQGGTCRGNRVEAGISNLCSDGEEVGVSSQDCRSVMTSGPHV